eukprot:TRINITY_DN7610_c0_g1_i1.p1 TRINITY_DN7610_c0_g1~~TRINITY_DN7610_c0_g1_i1.p1  ORF type:complete len:462 (-),score=60.63 TRINITY_DN7610_c0_g1_i1:99-1484(-)
MGLRLPFLFVTLSVMYWYFCLRESRTFDEQRNWTNTSVKNESLFSAQSIALPCGQTLSNRYVKAAMTESLVPYHGNPEEHLFKLYETWSLQSGCGMLISGNVMIDRNHLERSGNVIFDERTDKNTITTWANKCKLGNNKCLLQLSHPGRQANFVLQPLPVAPSEVEFKILFNTIKPRALTLEEISDIISRFANAAKMAVDGGFDGVQLHSAHGYLISQFLSPKENLRMDQYGGSLENRARFLLDAIKAVRNKIGSKKILGVKLNSSDFSKGGFKHSESLQVVKMIHELALVDFIEVSGGTYESLLIFGDKDALSNGTKEREAYFRKFAADASKILAEGDPATRPRLMLTGGIRSLETIESILQSNEADLVGIGRPLAVEPSLPQDMMNGRISGSIFIPFQAPSFWKELKLLVAYGETSWYSAQIWRLAEGKNPDPDVSAFWSSLRSIGLDILHKILRSHYQ